MEALILVLAVLGMFCAVAGLKVATVVVFLTAFALVVRLPPRS